ncbi:MAG: 5'-3' exonuclease H3TH domain-containing protein [Myxococcota bacterium]|jgi:5'-3' exonuclease|nr:5'-3' exonuclease H3TH domain-containing protein [Myxococcota bacterium]
MNLHLIDGTYELYRSYFGAPKARGPHGNEVGAVRGLLRSLVSLLRQEGVTHVAIAFDRVIESFRNDMFDGYKTGEGIEPDLWAQFPLAERAAEALGLVVWPMVDFEADDAIATACERYGSAKSVERIYICSPDKDLAQCVEGDRIVLVDRMRGRVIDEQGVVEKWGVEPASIPDLLGLMGDNADGIPGIARWGARSCASVLSVYRTIERIPRDVESWTATVRGAKTLSANLEAERAAAMLYRELAVLRRDVPLEEKLADLAWKGADRNELAAFLEEIGAARDLDRVPRFR